LTQGKGIPSQRDSLSHKRGRVHLMSPPTPMATASEGGEGVKFVSQEMNPPPSFLRPFFPSSLVFDNRQGGDPEVGCPQNTESSPTRVASNTCRTHSSRRPRHPLEARTIAE